MTAPPEIAAPLRRAVSASERERPLSERLVETAIEMLEGDGLEGLSLRAIARRAGVSHGAPLRHFRSHADLLAEVAAYGFRLLRSGLAEAANALPPGAGPTARLRAAGDAYVRVAVEHAPLFGLMFRAGTLDTTNASFTRDSTAAFDMLLFFVRAAQDDGWHANRDTRLLAGTIWAQVHGLASLWAQGAMLGPVPGASLDGAISLLLDISLSNPNPEA